MEFYKDRLIAYSLGNFAGGGKTLSGTGPLKYGAILHVSLAADGSFAGGKVFSTAMNAAGVPTRDGSNERGRAMIADLSEDDFGDTAARIGGTLPPEIELYTRRVTLVWCLFFAAQVLVEIVGLHAGRVLLLNGENWTTAACAPPSDGPAKTRSEPWMPRARERSRTAPATSPARSRGSRTRSNRTQRTRSR